MSERCEPGSSSVLDHHSFTGIEELRSQSHVAQQSRRDKLRVQQQQLHNSGIGGASLMPLYDHTVLSSEMLTFVTGNEVFVAQKDDRAAFQNQQIPIPHPGFKEDSENTGDMILNYGGSSSSYVTQNPLLGDPMVVGSLLSAGTLKPTNFSSSSPSSSQLYLMNPNFSNPSNPPPPQPPPQPPQSSLTMNPLPLNFHGFSPNPLAVEDQSLYTAQVPQNNIPSFGSFRFSNVSDGSFNDGVEFKQEHLPLRQDSTGQGLSLSLSFQNPPPELHLQQYETRFDCQNLAQGSGIFNVGQDEKNRQLIESGYCSYSRDRNSDRDGGKGSANMVQGGVRPSSSSSEIQKNLVPLGPFTGYATILKSSRFLKPAQQLLDDFCNVGHGVSVEMIKQHPSRSQETLREGGSGSSFDTSARVSSSNHCTAVSSSSLVFPSTTIEARNEGGIDDPLSSGGDRSDHQKKKMRLMLMLDEVCRRYRHYYEQVQVVVTSFESVAGLRTAAPYTSLALKTMSRHFQCLRNAIAGQLRSIRKALGEDCPNKEEIPRMRFVDHQRDGPRSGLLGQQHVWRPQRGLPERAVAVLRSWLFDNFLHPYPNDTDKQMLAKQTGLSRSQVSNWFINARVRLWKPMVEEMHMLEARESSSACAMDLNNSIRKPDTVSEEDINNRKKQEAKMTIEVLPDKQQQQNHDQPMKRSRSELAHMINREDSMNFSYENLAPSDTHMGVRIGNSTGGGVSLTLGLHHNGVQEKYHQNNNGIFLSRSETEPSMPIEVAHHFSSLQQQNNDNSQAFGIGGFVEAQQNMQLRKQMGCQLLHDFVG